MCNNISTMDTLRYIYIYTNVYMPPWTCQGCLLTMINWPGSLLSNLSLISQSRVLTNQTPGHGQYSAFAYVWSIFYTTSSHENCWIHGGICWNLLPIKTTFNKQRRGELDDTALNIEPQDNRFCMFSKHACCMFSACLVNIVYKHQECIKI